MANKYGLQTRIIKVYHPEYKDILLFEAQVQIRNLNKKLVEKIEGVDIKYKLTSTKLN